MNFQGYLLARMFKRSSQTTSAHLVRSFTGSPQDTTLKDNFNICRRLFIIIAKRSNFSKYVQPLTQYIKYCDQLRVS